MDLLLNTQLLIYHDCMDNGSVKYLTRLPETYSAHMTEANLLFCLDDLRCETSITVCESLESVWQAGGILTKHNLKTLYINYIINYNILVAFIKIPNNLLFQFFLH